jgi:hypothetical protein
MLALSPIGSAPDTPALSPIPVVTDNRNASDGLIVWVSLVVRIVWVSLVVRIVVNLRAGRVKEIVWIDRL